MVSELSENLYVDDLLSGTDSKTEVQELFTEAKRVLSKAGMDLMVGEARTFCKGSNSQDYRQKLSLEGGNVDMLK